MNIKKNILDAWITIEQLSEGSINTNDSEMKVLEYQDDYISYFQDFLAEKNVSNRRNPKAGFAVYFSIFPSQEIFNILAETYNLEKNYNEIVQTNKFSFVIYFNESINFLPDKTFCTINGYVFKNKVLPDLDEFLKQESSFKVTLTKKFEGCFNEAFSWLVKKFDINNIRYQYISDVAYDSSNFHSFLLKDLKKAKGSIHNEILSSYLGSNHQSRQDINSNNNSDQFNPALIADILQPINYPLGRFPSNTDHSLSLMQQVSVNLGVSPQNTCLSVNGPPGTGKTTLLKDIFSDLSVQQAFNICELTNKKKLKGEISYNDNFKLAILPCDIADKNIVVASSNNGAVQNIVNELPKEKDIDEGLLVEIQEIDYFQQMANCNIEIEWKDKKRNVNFSSDLNHDENDSWGLYSLEGGKHSNVQNLLDIIQGVFDELKNEHHDNNSDVYEEFLELYHELEENRYAAQKHKENLDDLNRQERAYKEKKELFRSRTNQWDSRIGADRDSANNQIEEYEYSKIEKQNNLREYIQQYAQSKEEELLYKILKEVASDKPAFFWLLKLFKSKKVNSFNRKVYEINGLVRDSLNKTSSEKLHLDNVKHSISAIDKEVCRLQEQIREQETEFQKAKKEMETELSSSLNKITTLEKIINSKDIEGLNFAQSYDGLQKSNPWFDKEFREKQSRLFILSLAVKKQFLLENRNNLLGAKMIWSKLAYYKEKPQGQALISGAWQWINFCIPVVSTTFASFGRMFEYIDDESIGNLFIDEAGQATPQSLVGGCIKSRRIIAVGDPSQIKPILSIEPEILSFIARKYEVSDKFVSFDSSVQSALDSSVEFGFEKPDGNWVGIPLWVHRRCNSPMFDISNKISYDNLMVQGKVNAKGIADWYDVGGNAKDKFVHEQAQELKTRITQKLNDTPSLTRDDIFVISPFKNVAYQLANQLKAIGFTKMENNKPENVGTVHTFQGKEAKIVYFVLGADYSSKGAANWAFQEANIMNVAVTRAKEEFYIIGDKALYQKAGGSIVKVAVELIEAEKDDAIR